MGHPLSFFHCFYQFNFSSTVFFFFLLFSEIQLWWDFFCLFFLLLWAVADILHGLVWDYVFFCYLYICLFPVLIALMVLSTVLPPYSLMLFSMANWAPQPTVLISPSTHPASSSFPSPLSIIGFRCQLYCENFANCVFGRKNGKYKYI